MGRQRSIVALVCGVGLAGLLAAPGAMAQPVVASIAKLSDEVRLTRFAYPAALAAVRREPSVQSPTVGRLRYLTEDGLPENYLLLSQARDHAGRTWVKIRLPQRPNGTTGWVAREALGAFRIVRTRLVVSRRKLTLTLYRNGRRIFRVPVGIGAPATPTPAGRFWIRERFPVSGVPLYGPFAIGTSGYAPTLSEWPNGGVVGIHGTDQPELIPGRPSHGCMRLRNKDITRLYRILPIGTPIRIL